VKTHFSDQELIHLVMLEIKNRIIHKNCTLSVIIMIGWFATVRIYPGKHQNNKKHCGG